MRNRLTTVLLAQLAVAGLSAPTVVADDQIQPDPPVTAGENEAPVPPHIAARIEAAQKAGAPGPKKDEWPKFEVVAKDFTKVVSTADGAKSMYTMWVRKKDAQMLAELPRNFGSQKLFIGFTIAGGTRTAGVQSGDMYAYWKRFDKRLALIEPNYAVRTSGDFESKKGRERAFTDRVIVDVPIVTMGPGGGPVIDMDALLLTKLSGRFGYGGAGGQTQLATIAKAKAFPKNVEIAYELPLIGGRFGTLHYSFSVLPENTGYQSRKADGRIGYFATTHLDIGHPGADTPWVRHINRWKLEKADPRLSMTPPKQPIVFYLEHTIPVRYRRWVREGVLEWNKAFEKVGIVNAVEVYQQDARTGAHMEKDPEDARYNFVLWTNANMGFAIGPSRVDPRSGQILDADIVMDEGFISSWVNAWQKVIPETAMLTFGPDTLAWLQERPQWDPRIRLAHPAERGQKMIELVRAGQAAAFAGHPAAAADPTLLGDDAYDGLTGRVSQVNGRCEYAMAASLELSLFRLGPDLIRELANRSKHDDEEDDDDADDDEGDDDEPKDEEDEAEDDEDDEDDDADAAGADEQMLDGVPEWFIGPLLRGVVMHEVGHTLGLRHNFKASSVYSLEEINSEAFKDRAITGSVMDYNPVNINFEDGETQGPYTMLTIGPYDYWAIEYGYTSAKDLKPVLSRVSEPELTFATDEDTWGGDPLTRVFDMGEDPLNYAESQLRLVRHLREKILERMVKDGQSWAKAREAYELLLSRHFGAVSISANWLGGTHVNRDFKGDPGERDPIAPVSVEQQRRALALVMANVFEDDAFGLTPELLRKMTVDKWFDDGGSLMIFEEPAWPVHDRILAIQASTLTMLMNPTTLNRVYDNEFRIPADEDALTLPEVLSSISDAVWSELDGDPDASYSARKPMISSLRRNLQREHLERLIDLCLPNRGFGVASKPIANLSTYKLRELQEKIEELTDGGGKLDPYTLAHLSEAAVRIEKALDAQYIYNTDDISSGSSLPFLLFGQEGEGDR